MKKMLKVAARNTRADKAATVIGDSPRVPWIRNVILFD